MNGPNLSYDEAARALLLHGQLDRQIHQALRLRLLAFVQKKFRLGDEAEDVVSATILSAFQAHASGRGERILNAAAYVQTICENRVKDAIGQRRRHELVLDSSGQPPDVGVIVEPVEAMDIVAGLQLFEALVQRVAADKKKHEHRVTFLQAIEEMQRMAASDCDMDTILRERGLAPDADFATYKRLRDLLQKRHQRARDELALAVESGSASGTLTTDEAELLRVAIKDLLRRQNDRPRDVER